MMLELIGSMALLLALLNAWATRAILLDVLASPGQKKMQVVFVWLLPVIGALLVMHLKRKELKSSSGHYPAEPDSGDDFAMSEQNATNIKQAVKGESE